MSFSSDKELKPCPFCGCEVIELEQQKGSSQCILECVGCGHEVWYPNADAAIQRWNRRNAAEGLKAAIEGIRTAWFSEI